MGCDKRYGLREIWVAPEASPNTPATYTSANYLPRCTGTTFPAVYRENLENGEATGNRGQSTPFDGAQNELAFDVTVTMPSSSEMAAPTSLPKSLQSLFWAAGFGGSTAPTSWTPGASGVVIMAVQAGSACGRTLQIIGLDRDKRQLELLTGAVISQVVFTFSRTDPCTIQFSGVAAQKFQATAPVIAPSDISQTTFTAITRTSYDVSLPTSPAILTGVSLALPDANAELASISVGSIALKNNLSGSAITADTQAYWVIPKPNTPAYDVLAPENWSLPDIRTTQSATVTVETGQTYGELTTEAKYPTEILSGQVKVSASVTAYIVDSNSGALDYDTGYPLPIYFGPGGTGTSLNIANAKLSEVPAIDLSNVDEPASGDFSLVAGETGTFLSYNLLDVAYVN